MTDVGPGQTGRATWPVSLMSRTKFTRNFLAKCSRDAVRHAGLAGWGSGNGWQLFIADARTNVLHSGDWQEFIDTLNRTL